MRKRSIAIKGHRTSIALEAPFWDVLESLAKQENKSLASLVADIDRERMKNAPQPGLASALRVYALSRSTSAVRDESQ